MITGIGVFFSSVCVCALNALQNSMMLRPRCPGAGPMGGEGFPAPAGTCNFRYPVTFFAMCYSRCAGLRRRLQVSWFGSRGWQTARFPPRPRSARSDLLDLTEFQFDRRRAAEDRNRDLHARARLVDFLDHTGERRERTVRHAHVFADLDTHPR